MKALLKTKCGCKKIMEDHLAPSLHNVITIHTGAKELVHPADPSVIHYEDTYRKFRFKEVNIHNVAVYEEI